MALRSNQDEIPFKRFEADGTQAFDIAMRDALEVVEEQGVQGRNDDPETIIVLRDGEKGPHGTRLVQTIIYIGATIQQVAEDLNTRS